MISERTWFAAKLLAAVFALHLGAHLVTTALFWRAGRTFATSIGFSTGGRNISIAIAALGQSVPPDTWLFFALIQFPIYLLPMVLKPVYQRLHLS